MDQSGATVPVHSIKAYMVYDRSSGRVHHEHRVMTLVGGREPPDAQMAADALKAANRRGRHAEGALEVLAVDHRTVEPGKTYRVDLHAKTLVPL